jgi:pimeloyl-ACP methyl ester carboxylesterase
MSPKLTNNSEWKWGYNKGTYTEDMLKYDIVDIREDTKGFKQRVYIDFLNYIRKDENKIERPNVLHKAAAMLFFPQIIVDTWEDLFSQDYRDVLSKITRPCAIIYGNPGSIYSEGTAEYMNSKIKNSTMFALEGIRHENMLKQTSKIVDIIKEYI